MTLRLVSVEARGPHASRVVDLGHLVCYAEGVPHSHQPRPRTVVRCARDTLVPLDLEAPRTGHRLHVHWFPYLNDRLCRGRRVQRRGGYAVIEDLRRPPERLLLEALHESEDDLVLVLRWQTAPVSWGGAVEPERPPRDYESDLQCIRAYLNAAFHSFYATRHLAPDAADRDAGDWTGSLIQTPAGTLPMCALGVAAEKARYLATPALLKHWCWLAAERLGVSPHTVADPDTLSELLGEVGTTRLWALAYQADVSISGRSIDDWAGISETPDLTAAAYDCEDGTFDVLSVLASLAALPKPERHGLVGRLAAHAERYVFLQALGRMRSGDGFVWHSYVVGLDRAVVRSALARESSGSTAASVPPLLIETTQYTTSHWGYTHPQSSANATVSGEAFRCVDATGDTDVVHAKVPGALLRELGPEHYRQTFTVFLPPELHREAGGAEVVLSQPGQPGTYGVPTAAFLRDPGAAQWEVVPGWNNTDLQEALARVRTQLPPWPVLDVAAAGHAHVERRAGERLGYMRVRDFLDLRHTEPHRLLVLHDGLDSGAPPLQMLEVAVGEAGGGARLRPAGAAWAKPLLFVPKREYNDGYQ